MHDHIILLHGIWMRGITLAPLARRLRARDFSVEVFDYASVVGSWEASAAKLAQRWRDPRHPRVHVVGHSLGGMLAMYVAQTQTDLPEGNLVCLGSPLKGSAAAHRMRGLPGGHWALGKSLPMLLKGFEQWSGERAVGVIAGKRPIGLGGLVGKLERPHDGTVSVVETHLAGITDHRVVNATHSGLVFSPEVLELIADFLRHGRFPSERHTS
jgi:pimeloyl-ACP methyl ester carboxylesterase